MHFEENHFQVALETKLKKQKSSIYPDIFVCYKIKAETRLLTKLKALIEKNRIFCSSAMTERYQSIAHFRCQIEKQIEDISGGIQ
jgi:hypothetical protein